MHIQTYITHIKYTYLHRYLHGNIHMQTYKYPSSKQKSSIISLAVSANLWNILKCFPKIFFNSKTTRTHSLPYILIHINKRLTRVTILVRSAVVLSIRRISEPTETWNIFVILLYCFLVCCYPYPFLVYYMLLIYKEEASLLSNDLVANFLSDTVI